jgi:hypothetical protein
MRDHVRRIVAGKQKIGNAWRDFRIVIRSIWVNLLLFFVLLVAGMLALRLSSTYSDATTFELVTSVFHMAILERVAEHGDGIVAQLLTFIVPMLTVVILGEGVLRVLGLYLRRAKNREEWDLMVAKTYSNHVVLCGAGQLGRALYGRLITEDPDQQIVLIDTRADILAELGEAGNNTCHLQMDMTAVSTLEAANCAEASLIIIASGNDAYNLETAYKAEQLCPTGIIWVRLYRSGLTSLMDLGTKPNIHFFSPYEAAAETLIGQIQG